MAPASGFARLERILFTTDLSANSDAAYQHARLLAARFAAALLVYHASEVPSRAYVSWAGHEERAAAAEATAADLRRRLAVGSVAPPVNVEADVVASETDLAIVRAVHSSLPDLVVMATHARAGLAHACLGSVLERVLCHHIRPVLCVPPAASAARPYHRLLVPIDRSEASLRALPWAGKLAEAFGSTIVVLHALTPDAIGETHAALRGAQFDEARLAALVRPRLPGLSVEAVVAIAAPAWSAITHAARERNADLVVMASQGRHGLGETLLGSTAERVIRHSHLPVLVV